MQARDWRPVPWRSSRARRGFFTSVRRAARMVPLQWWAVRGSRKARRTKAGTPTPHGLPPSLAWGKAGSDPVPWSHHG